MLVLTRIVPSNLFLNKIGKPALYLPAVMCVWGIISTCTAAVQSFGGLVAVRFVLGFVEAAYFRKLEASQSRLCDDANHTQAGCLFFLSSWYTRKELAFRSAVLYSGSLISGAFSGLIAAGILDGMSGHLGLSAWRWLCEYRRESFHSFVILTAGSHPRRCHYHRDCFPRFLHPPQLSSYYQMAFGRAAPTRHLETSRGYRYGRLGQQ